MVLSTLAATSQTLTAADEVQIVPEKEAQCVFAVEAKGIRLVLRNAGSNAVGIPLQARLYQMSSATMMPVGAPQPWKTVRLLPQQTAIESAPLSFPEVRTVAPFEIRWMDGKNGEVGRSVVHVCSPGLLRELTAMAGHAPIGIIDTDNSLAPVLRTLKVEYQELALETGFDDYEGHLAIIGPFPFETKLPEQLSSLMASASRKTVLVVCLQASRGPLEPMPNARLIHKGRATIAVLDARLVTNLAESASAQLSLLRCIQWAQHDDPGKL